MARKVLIQDNIDPTKGADLIKAFVAKLPPGMTLGSTTTRRFEDGTGRIIYEVFEADENKIDNFGISENLKTISNEYDFKDSPEDPIVTDIK